MSVNLSTKHTRGFGRVNMLANLLQAAVASDAAAWYDNERAELQGIARKYGVDYEIVAAVVAHVSPMMPWQRNKFVAEVIIEVWYLSGDAAWDVLTGADKGLGLPANIRKAVDVLTSGNPHAAKFGPKTGKFYANLTGNQDEVTVDRHHASIAMGLRKAGEVSVRPAAIVDVQHLTRIAADVRGMTPAEFQAAAWVARRESLGMADW